MDSMSIAPSYFSSASPTPLPRRCSSIRLSPPSSRPFPFKLPISRPASAYLRPVAAQAASDLRNPDGGVDEDWIEGEKTGGYFGSLPKLLASWLVAGCVLAVLHLKKFQLVRWLSQFGGFDERISADDLFLHKAGIEGGVHVFNKTAAEYDRRKGDFLSEFEIVLFHVVPHAIAHFMLVYLTAPTVSLGAPLGTAARPFERFIYSCPSNAFQVAPAGTSYSALQRVAAVGLTGVRLFVVGSTSCLVGKAMENAFINLRKAANKSLAVEVEMVPIVSTSIAHGLHMAVFANLRYQVLSGIVEQRVLAPLLLGDPLILCAAIFAIRAGNAHLGSLLRPVTYKRDNASSLNELVEPKSNVTAGASNQDDVFIFRFFDMSLCISVVEGKLEFKLKRITLR